MNLNKKIRQCIGIVLTAAIIAAAGVVKVQGAFYEDQDTGARARAMGGAYAAEVNKVDGAFYNPAAMAGLTNIELDTSYEQKFMGLSDESELSKYVLGMGIPLNFGDLDLGAAGFSLNRFGLDNLYSETALGVFYGYPVLDNFLLGTHVKLLSVNYKETEYTLINPIFDKGYTSSVFSTDVGVIYRLSGRYNLGVSILNANSPDIGLEYENRVKRNIRLGGSMRTQNLNLNFSLTHLPGSIRARTGMETWLLNRSLFFRGGFNIGSANYRNLTLGFGYNYDKISVDYSWSYPLSGINDMLGNHQISCSYYFGEEKPEEEFEGGRAPSFGGRRVAGPGTSGSILDPDSPVPAHVVEKNLPESQKEEAAKAVEEGQEALEQQNYRLVLEKYREANDLLEGDPEIQDQLSKLDKVVEYVPSNEFDREEIEELPPAEREEAQKRYRLLSNGIEGILKDNSDKAIRNIAYAAQLWPDDKNIKGLLTDVVQERFPTEYANKKFYIETNWVNQLLAESLEYFYDGRYSMAIRKCRQVLELEPTNTVALTRLGSIHWARGDEEVAYSLWQRVLEIDPDNREVLPMIERYEEKQ
ncbi:MAG: hypothetical protein ACQEQC_02600 [Elusimicrobiota bacterium]